MTSRGFNIGSFTTSTHVDELRADEFRLDVGLAVLEKHLDDFFEIRVELIEALGLGVRARESRNEADIEAGIGISLHDSRECSSHLR